MSAYDTADAAGRPHGDIHHLLGIGNSVVLVLMLFVMTISIVLVVGLRNDVAALEDQARRSTKAMKALQDDLASLKELIPAAQPKSEPGGVRAENIDAAAPGRDCVIGVGNRSAVANCIDLEPTRSR